MCKVISYLVKKIIAMKKYLFLVLLFVGFINDSWSQDPKRFAEDIKKFEELDKQNPPEDVILFVGSSSIRFWTTLKQDFPNHKILNRGFGGSHMSDLLFYLDKLVLKYAPKKVFIYEGDNDINDKEDSNAILKEAQDIVKKIHDVLPKTKVIFISAKPSIARWNLKDQYLQLNKLFKNYANQFDYLEFIDVWNPMLDRQGNPKKDIFIEDNLHMNAKGYEIWKKVIEPYLKK